MRQRLDGGESVLEIGLVVIFGLILGAVAILFGGQLFGGIQRHRRHAEPPPSRGVISPKRHKGTAVVAAR